MMGSVKEGREQTKGTLASATSVQGKVQHIERNITSFKPTLTEAQHGYQTMGKDVVRVEKREHEDMMACVGGIEEAKDIWLRVIGETQGLRDSWSTQSKGMKVSRDCSGKKNKNQEKDAQPGKSKGNNRFFRPQKRPRIFCAAVWQGRQNTTHTAQATAAVVERKQN